MENNKAKSFLILSPVLVLVVTQATAILLGRYLDAQVYIPVILIYWVGIGLLVLRYGREKIRGWLRRPQWSWIWTIVAVLVGFSSMPIFLKYLYLLKDISIAVPYILFFLINPWLEEFYWRGLLIDATGQWPVWTSLLYSCVFFTLWHAAFVWQSDATRTLPFFIAVFVLGMAMALIRWKTRSLWICIFSHMLINMTNMGIPILMNVIQP